MLVLLVGRVSLFGVFLTSQWTLMGEMSVLVTPSALVSMECFSSTGFGTVEATGALSTSKNEVILIFLP